ncbi:hypothetical protein Ddye_025897 [Dipteronia dyeriana]|uniref:Uncharacterized protein n=1 Tax=Dipteronia dyeriana TaxID=168575 RepID=A0AAD9WPW1_9ROSI|nr:hypothetical protein Ddye_025897 [Dipteronia dyeriana]
MAGPQSSPTPAPRTPVSPSFHFLYIYQASWPVCVGEGLSLLRDSEELQGVLNSEEGRLSREEILTLIQKEVRKGLKRVATAGEMKPIMKRVRKGSMEREMRAIKRGMQEMKRLIQNLTRNAPTDRNVNPRTSTRSEEGKLQLVFVSKLYDSIFTKDKIKDENGEYVEIKLIDTIIRETVEAGDLSSIEIEIVVLEGDFGFEGNWTEQEFNAKIVNRKKDKGPLLVKGNQVITLKNGVGTVDDLSFFDNSNGIKCGKFRLGARVLQSISRGQLRIKEARSEAFVVKNQRGKVTHVKKIEKGGKFHKALIDNNIHTESDLKQMCKTNRDKLREILKDCSNNEWDAIVQHAIRLDDADSNPLRIQEAEAFNNATTGPPLRDQCQSFHQGSTGMLNDRDLASLSSPYESTAYPTCQPLPLRTQCLREGKSLAALLQVTMHLVVRCLDTSSFECMQAKHGVVWVRDA